MYHAGNPEFPGISLVLPGPEQVRDRHGIAVGSVQLHGLIVSDYITTSHLDVHSKILGH